jgi:hypothetical protein
VEAWAKERDKHNASTAKSEVVVLGALNCIVAF